MIILPVIERELRSLARQPSTYHLRVLGAVALLGVLGKAWLEDVAGPAAGARLFTDFHLALFCSIWVLVPLLTADCISRERREGTLPLLFLTPLRARDIVYAKGLVHVVRSFMLWLAVLPVITVCFLGGGVSWPEVILSALVNFSSICLALGAGLLASARARVWTRAAAFAACLTVLLLACFVTLLLYSVLIFWSLHATRPWPTISAMLAAPAECMAVATNLQLVLRWWLTTFRRGPQGLLVIYGLLASGSVLVSYSLIRLSAWNLAQSWQDRPHSARAVWWKDKLFRPVLFREQLHRWLRWQLQRNPIGWLGQRSWSGRLVVWSWFAVVMCVYSSIFTNLALYHRAFHMVQSFLATLLAGSLAITAAGSFQRERETGVLELLLVTPLSESQIIFGRVRGLWAQFLPAICLLSAVWLYASTFLSPSNEVPSLLGYALTFATLPIVGLYFSLAKPNFISAMVWTLLVEMVMPAAFALILNLGHGNPQEVSNLFAQALFQLAITTFLAWRLLVLLKNRRFLTPEKPEIPNPN